LLGKIDWSVIVSTFHLMSRRTHRPARDME